MHCITDFNSYNKLHANLLNLFPDVLELKEIYIVASDQESQTWLIVSWTSENSASNHLGLFKTRLATTSKTAVFKSTKHKICYSIIATPLLLSKDFKEKFPNVYAPLGTYAWLTPQTYTVCLHRLIQLRYKPFIEHFTTDSTQIEAWRRDVQALQKNFGQYSALLDKFVRGFDFADYMSIVCTEIDAKSTPALFQYKLTELIEQALCIFVVLGVPMHSLVVLQRLLKICGYHSVFVAEVLYLDKDGRWYPCDVVQTYNWVRARILRYHKAL